MRHRNKSEYRKRLITLFVITVFAVVSVTGCAETTARTQDATEVRAKESSTEQRDAEIEKTECSLMYTSVEERQHQPKPDYDINVGSCREIYSSLISENEIPLSESNDKSTTFRKMWGSSNKFLMVEGTIQEPSPLKVNEYRTEDRTIDYVTGTLYELFKDGVPENDLVYFPGDDLPEGYEVRITKNYKFRLSTGIGSHAQRDEQDEWKWYLTDNWNSSYVFLAQVDQQNKVKYDIDYGSSWWSQYITTTENIPIGSYFEITSDKSGHINILYQYLTKEDMEKLPPDTVFVESCGKPSLKVAHY